MSAAFRVSNEVIALEGSGKVLFHVVAEEVSRLNFESILLAGDHGHRDTLSHTSWCIQVRWNDFKVGPRRVLYVLVVHLYLESENASTVQSQLAIVRAVTVVRGDTDRVFSVDPRPVQEIFNVDRALPVVMMLIHGKNLNLTGVTASNKKVIVDVLKLDLEQVSSAGCQV